MAPSHLRKRGSRTALQGTLVAAVAVALSPRASAQPEPCGAWEIEYVLAANLQLSDTPMGKGDGVYPVGPGKVALRFEDRDGQPAGRVTMTAYELQETFTITNRALFWYANVVTDAMARATPGTCGAVAEGTLTGSTVGWSTPLRGYRTDGAITCDGSLCGKFGAPPLGRSELHIGPGPVQFSSFDFARDLKTFTMQNTFVSKTETPMQTARVALAGREVRRACVPVTPCR